MQAPYLAIAVHEADTWNNVQVVISRLWSAKTRGNVRNATHHWDEIMKESF